MRDVLLKALYWLAVVAVSLVLVIALILFLESRDQSSLDEADSAPIATVSPDLARLRS